MTTLDGFAVMFIGRKITYLLVNHMNTCISIYYCHFCTDTSTTLNIHGILDPIGKAVSVSTAGLSEPAKNANDTSNVIRKL